MTYPIELNQDFLDKWLIPGLQREISMSLEHLDIKLEGSCQKPLGHVKRIQEAP